MIGFSEDGEGFRFRSKCEARIAGNVLYSVWHPWADVKVETWLIPQRKWHLRVHRIFSSRTLTTVEGGFAISALEPARKLIRNAELNSAYVMNKEDFSGIINIHGVREGLVNYPEPLSNLYFSKTVVPQLRGQIEANKEIILACAVIAMPDKSIFDTDWFKVPKMPSVEDLERLVRESVPVLEKASS
jgi:hypothetical protein